MITIYNFARGGRGLRAAWLCEEMGLAYELQFVTFPPSEAYKTLNPLGTVPFLQDDGVAINESIAIVLYLAERYGPTPLLPGKNDPALARVLQMLVFSEATFGSGMNVLMAAHFGAPESDKQNWSVRVQESLSESALQFIARALGDGPYLTGEQVSLADLAIATSLGVWRGALNKAIPDKLVAYRERLGARPAYQRALSRVQG